MQVKTWHLPDGYSVHVKWAEWHLLISATVMASLSWCSIQMWMQNCANVPIIWAVSLSYRWKARLANAQARMPIFRQEILKSLFQNWMCWILHWLLRLQSKTIPTVAMTSVWNTVTLICAVRQSVKIWNCVIVWRWKYAVISTARDSSK